jgi:hypothetical protein
MDSGLQIALIASLSALGGATVGGVAQYVVQRARYRHEREEERRDERRDAYAALVSAYSNWLHLAEDGHTAEYGKFAHAVDVVELIGGAGVLEALPLYKEACSNLKGYFEAGNTQQSDEADAWIYPVAVATQELTRAMRRDLGAD